MMHKMCQAFLKKHYFVDTVTQEKLKEFASFSEIFNEMLYLVHRIVLLWKPLLYHCQRLHQNMKV